MPLTDHEIAERLSQFEANSDDWRHVLNAAGIPEDDPKFGIKLSLEQRALTDLVSTRQQLTALRDKWREEAKQLTSGRVDDPGFKEMCYAASAKEKAADELDQILKGTP